MQPADQFDLLDGSETFVEIQPLWDDPDAAFDLNRLFLDLESANASSASGGRQQGREHIDRGRFARSVGTQESEDDASGHG